MGMSNYQFCKLLDRMEVSEMRDICHKYGVESRGTRSALTDRLLETADPVMRTDMITDIIAMMANNSTEGRPRKRKRGSKTARSLEAAFDAVADR